MQKLDLNITVSFQYRDTGQQGGGVTFISVLPPSPVTHIMPDDPFPPSHIKLLAHEKKYNLMTFNRHHYIVWIKIYMIDKMHKVCELQKILVLTNLVK